MSTELDSSHTAIPESNKISSNTNLNVARNSTQILYLNFNKDGTRILIGHELGFSVLDSITLQPQITRNLNKAVGLIQVAENSNIFAIRGGGFDPMCPTDELIIWDEIKAKTVANLQFKNRVIGVEMTNEL